MKNKIPVALLFASLAITGCAGQKALDAKVAKEPAVQNSAELHLKADRLLQEDKSITPEQRQKIQELRASVQPQLAEIGQHELRLRTVLLEELMSPNYSIDEVALIKKRLKKLEDRRLALTFKLVDDTTSILGHDQAQKHRKMLRAMLNEKEVHDTAGHSLE
jgi:hypothetical protein